MYACNVLCSNWTRSWVEMASSSQDQKQAFFTRLDELDDLALENVDEARNDSIFKIRRLCSSTTLHPEPPSCKPAASNSQVSPNFVPMTTRVDSLACLSKETMPAQTSIGGSGFGKVPPKLSKKQSSKKSLHFQPEDAQIFRGLTFCETTLPQPSPLSHLTDSRFFTQQ